MSNDLMNIDLNNLPAHLRADDEGQSEFSPGAGAGLDIPFLSIRGKEFRFRYQGEETSTRSRHIDVVMVRGRPNMSKRWYGSKYEPGSVEGPDCYSLDGVTPAGDSTAIQSDKCATCPRNQFGSKITPSGKQGKECSDYKRLAVLPVLENQLTSQPVILDLPYTSLKKSKADRRDIQFLQEYSGALNRHRIKPWGVVTRLEFTDSEYPQVSFSVVRLVTEAEMAQIEAAREDETVDEALSVEQVEASGPITEHAAPAPAPEPKPEPKPDTGEADVMNLLRGNKQQAKPEPKPEPEKQETVAEAEKVYEPNPAATDDVMAQVRATLAKLNPGG